MLGAAWRENLRWPDGGIDATPDQIRSAVDLIRRARPRTIAMPYWDDRHPDHVAASAALRQAIFKSGLSRYVTAAEAWRPEWVCHYFINDSTAPSFVIDVSAHYDAKRAALACYRSQFSPADPASASTRLNAPTFRQLIESRDAAVRRARRRGVRRGHRRARAGAAQRAAQVVAHRRLGR